MSASSLTSRVVSKALIVDDHASMRRLIKSLLPKAMEGLECPDGDGALAIYRRERPALVIMDISMPVKDGFVAAAEIRDFDPAARIIFVSQAADDEMRARVLALGAFEFLPKERLSELPGLLARAN